MVLKWGERINAWTNRILSKVIQQYAYAQPPDPTSHALVDALQEQTPPELRYLIKDPFEDITIFSNRTLGATAHPRADGKYDVTIQVETRKYKADAKSNETEVPINDYIDIGAFAKPAKGKIYGDTLYRERMHITGNKSAFTFVTASLPEKAGIDPFALLIDRVPGRQYKNCGSCKRTNNGAKANNGTYPVSLVWCARVSRRIMGSTRNVRKFSISRSA